MGKNGNLFYKKIPTRYAHLKYIMLIIQVQENKKTEFFRVPNTT